MSTVTPAEYLGADFDETEWTVSSRREPERGPAYRSRSATRNPRRTTALRSNSRRKARRVTGSLRRRREQAR